MNINADSSKIKLYLENKFTVLGKNALSRERIYLDTNFWVNIRDHISGKNYSQEILEFLNFLRPQVENGRLICTFSSYTFSELMKHLDQDVRLHTANIIDELSDGFCLANPERIMENELSFLALKFINSNLSMQLLKELAWARPFFLLNDYCPPTQDYDSEVELKIQMEFIDEMWSMNMTDFINLVNSRIEDFPVFDWPVRATESINSDIRKFDSENNSFTGIYISELNGLFHLFSEQAASLYCKMLSCNSSDRVPKNSQEFQACQMIIHNAVIHLAKKNLLKNYLPSIHVECMIHAMIRNDKRRKFKPNDLIDIRHSGMALPYCSFFLTDKPNAKLIKSAKLDMDFDCIICDNTADAKMVIEKSLSIR